MLSATPAVDATLSEAARLAGAQPVASHHLLVAVLSDPGSAAARALTGLGIDLDRARTALRDVDITGTSDEPPEEAGRRAMTVRVDGERVIVEAGDPAILDIAKAALAATGDETSTVISGDTPVAASLSNVWQALRDSLESIQRTAKAAAEPQEAESGDPPDASAT
ncbi:MAG TPA: Clp protease N-terminal domain-containing protein [Streptosporangiaceae bacterium]|nr:Clp protease N-terminal domain-containing protein [Streptosporangiaceae bacterium]